jgi:hypothetical protein
MSAGYLGKISAIVTVNTTDIASKVQSGFAAPFDKALRSIETTLRNTNRSVEKSFGDIYTASQKQVRAIAAAQMGAVKGFDAEDFGKRLRIRDDISEPVKKLALEIEKTGGILRGNFEPQIVSLQAASQALFDKMATDAASVSSGEISELIRRVESLGVAFKAAGTAADGWERLSAIGRGDKGTRGTDLLFAGLGAASRRAVGVVESGAARDAAAMQADKEARDARFATLGAAGREAIGTSQMFATLGQRVREQSVDQNAANEALEQQRRIWAVRDADQAAFEQRQRAAAQQIHAEEQAAIAAERAAREAGERQAQEAAQAELRSRELIRQRIQEDFQERQRLTAQLIYDEEQAAIAAERADRERDERRREMLDENAARMRDASQYQMQADAAAERSAAARLSGAVGVARTSATDEFRESFGGRGAAGINLGLDRRALTGYTAELQVLQRAIGNASAEARGPAVEAFVRLKNAIGDAFESGEIGTVATRRNIERLRNEAVNEASSATGRSRQGLGQEVGRAGDIARGGVDKLSLALQQAGFAIDDFFSATGGLDQKIRAVSNNISQMAFILGGTAGLFTGLAFTIGSQAVVALLKWADAGRTSADRTEALNKALERQKSLAEELTTAYRDLAKSLTAAMSPQGVKAADRAKQLSDLTRTRQQSMEEDIYANDTGVASARASVAMEEKRALLSLTPVQQQAAQLRIKIAKQQVEVAKRESLARNAAFNDFVDRGVGGGPGAAVQASIQQAIQTFGRIRMDGMDPGDARRFEEFVNAQMNAVPIAADKEGAAAQLRAFLDQEFRTNEIARAPGAVAAPVVGALLEQLARLEFGLKAANSAIIDEVNKSLLDTSDVIEKAKNTLDSAAMETQEVAALRTEIDRVATTLAALSVAASETTDKAVLDAIAEDAAAAKAFGDKLNEAARGVKEFADQIQAAIAEEAAAAARGVDLGRVRDQASQAEDIRAAAANIGNDADRRSFIERAFGNVVADTQTALKGFGMERENALLGGPSRAALNASDVSTFEGQRELNRLLRGDDASRDVNFAEMKHQSELLQTIADRILAATGVAVEFR